MGFSSRFLLPFALALSVIPGLKTIAKAGDQQWESPPNGPLDIPRCAMPAMLTAVTGSGCSLTDSACICSKQALFPNLIAAIAESCSPADVAAMEALGQTYCGINPKSITVVPVYGATTTTGVTTLTIGESTKSVTAVITSDNGIVAATSTGGAAAKETGLSAMAFVGAVAGMGCVFAEL